MSNQQKKRNRIDYGKYGVIVGLITIIITVLITLYPDKVKCWVSGFRSPSCPPPSDPQLISSKTKVDYTSIREFLKQENWREADKETTKKILQSVHRERNLRKEDVQKLHCDDLAIINELWLEYSDGKFGFSVQRNIYIATLGEEYNTELLYDFGNRLGWINDKKRVRWEDLNFDKNAPKGHLPAHYIMGLGNYRPTNATANSFFKDIFDTKCNLP